MVTGGTTINSLFFDPFLLLSCFFKRSGRSRHHDHNHTGKVEQSEQEEPQSHTAHEASSGVISL